MSLEIVSMTLAHQDDYHDTLRIDRTTRERDYRWEQGTVRMNNHWYYHSLLSADNFDHTLQGRYLRR